MMRARTPSFRRRAAHIMPVCPPPTTSQLTYEDSRVLIDRRQFLRLHFFVGREIGEEPRRTTARFLVSFDILKGQEDSQCLPLAVGILDDTEEPTATGWRRSEPKLESSLHTLLCGVGRKWERSGRPQGRRCFDADVV